ncbi:MAG: cation diffusion facilitator family transporter [Chloroflexota bacterium]
MLSSKTIAAQKILAARLLIGVVIGLILFKMAVSWFTRSISIMAQTTDSLLDLCAGIVTFATVRIATKPADENHPYGHGKVEDMGSLVQGALIMVASVLIIVSAVERIMAGVVVKLVEAGIGVMLLSIVVSIVLSRHLLRVAHSTDSLLIEANAHNIAADVYSAVAVLLGLLLVRLTNLNYIDAIIAIGVALYIFVIALRVLARSLAGLIDARLSPEQEAIVRETLKIHNHEVAGFHELRSRRSGSERYIDLHLVMDKQISLEEAHRICDHIEGEIKDKLRGANVTIHAEPCDSNCKRCPAVCSKRNT